MEHKRVIHPFGIFVLEVTSLPRDSDESVEGTAILALKDRVKVKVNGDLKKDSKGRAHHIDVKKVVQRHHS